MKLGGLFSGVGGFELAWTQLGHEVSWMCEIDKSARKVLEHRFPGVPIYEDVQQLDPSEVEAVDVLTGGSPCQGFSVAGQRTGLLHGESRLFADYVRIMNGLAERGLKWALWENVPGVLSITNDDGERTFPHVAAALVGAEEPLRLGAGRWNSGLADGGRRAVAWRILDSRHFGVAQRRRRVFACAAFGDFAADRAGRALLAKSQSVSGDSASGESEGQSSSGGVAGGAGVPRFTGAVTSKWSKGTGGPSGDEAQNLVTDTPKMLFVRGGVEVDRHGKKAGKGALLTDDESATLDAGNHWTLFQPQAFRKSRRPQTDQDAETWIDDGNANTLNTFDSGETRTTHAVVEAKSFDEMNFTASDTHHVLRSGTKQSTGALTEYGVRRLTPVECERLQSFPDGWTEPSGSDSARYKAMGNAVTVNTVRWILGRMLEQS